MISYLQEKQLILMIWTTHTPTKVQQRSLSEVSCFQGFQSMISINLLVTFDPYKSDRYVQELLQ